MSKNWVKPCLLGRPAIAERGFKVNTGTIVDATIIAAPSSTKNADKARDPDMHQTRKGQQWYFGMKPHWRGQPKRAGAQRRGDGGQRA